MLTSFKPASDAIAVPPTVLPERFSLDNYLTALNRPGVTASFINSVSTAVIATVRSMALAVPAAWGITRYRSGPGRR